MKQLRVINIIDVSGKYPSNDEYADIDYEIEFVDLHGQHINILFPKRYFQPFIINGEVIEEATLIIKNELYSCKFNGTFKNSLNDDNSGETFLYSLTCNEKNFNLFYDEKFEELH